MTSRRPLRAASAAGARGRTHHSLAPEHLSEATAAATVAVIVGGVALVITGIGMAVMALTLSGRYGENQPPDLGSMMILPLLGGIGLVLLGGALTAGALGVLGDARRARRPTGALSALTAALAAAGVVAAMARPPADVVLATALAVATLVYGAAAILLLRPRR